MRWLLLLITLFPTAASAATYDLLAPIGAMSTGLSLTTYLQGMFQFLIGMAGILAVVMIVWCGIKMMGTGSVAAKSEAKQCITNAVLGVLLAAGSWIILNTINSQLLLSDLNLGNTATAPITTPPPTGSNDPMPTQPPGWYFRFINGAGDTKNSPPHGTSEQCLSVMKKSEDNGTVISVTGGVKCFEIKPVGTPPPAAGEAATRNALCGNNSCVGSTPIGINKASCPYRNSKGCTDVAGLSAAAVATIQALQAACGCTVIITGGTEGGHSTSASPSAIHLPGNGVFDLRWDGDSSALSNRIKSGGTRKASFSGNYRWLYNGFWYTDEVSAAAKGGVRHWHVCPDGASAPYCKP